MRDPTPPKPAFDLVAAIGAQLAAAQQALALPEEEKRVHGARVAIKRARALARVASLAELDAPLRDAMHIMADARDLAALAATARAEARRAKGEASRAMKAAALSLEREHALLAPPSLDAVRARIAAAYEIVHRASALADAEAGAARILQRARKAYGKASGRKGERRHTWRKREKDRLYLMELAKPLAPEKTKTRARQTAKLCDLLGREHDLELLRDKLGGKAKRADRALAKRQRIMAARADALGAKVHRGGA